MRSHVYQGPISDQKLSHCDYFIMTFFSRQLPQASHWSRQSLRLTAKRPFTTLTSAFITKTCGAVYDHNPAQFERRLVNDTSHQNGNIWVFWTETIVIFRRHPSYNSKVVVPTNSTGSSSQSYHRRLRSYDRPSSYDFSTSNGSTALLTSSYSSTRPYSSIKSGGVNFAR